MTTASTTLLGLALPVTGELSGTWGDVVNASLTNLLDTAIAGTTTLSSDADVTLTTTTLSANQARQAVILWTAGGTVTRTITAPAQSKPYIVINKTSSSQSIKIVGVGPTTGVTIVAGTAALVVWNGVDFVTASVTSTTGIVPVANGGTGLASGTSGGVLAYTATGTLASSAALAASALVLGGGAGAAPATTTTGTGVVTALGVNTGSAGAFVVNGGALGSPSSAGTIPAFTLGGTVAGGGNQLNNVIIGTTTPLAGSFTTLSATGAISSTGVTDATSTTTGMILTAGGISAQKRMYATGFIGINTGAINGISFNSSHSGVASTVFGFNNSGGTSAGVANLSAYIQQQQDYPIAIAMSGSTIGLFSTTGLAVTGTLSATGLTTLGSVSSGIALAVTSSAPTYTGSFINSSATSAGLLIKAGSTSGHEVLDVQTYNATSLFKVLASGAVTIPGTLAAGATTVTGTLSSTGTLLVGQTTASNSINGLYFDPAGGGNANIVHASGTTSGTGYAFFLYAGSSIGSITQNGTTGVLYNLTSDYRLKNNQQPLTGAKDFIMALKPKKWQWWDGSGEGVGFVAHEFMEVAKYSGHGEKDAVEMQTYEISPAVPATQDKEGNEVTAAIEAVMGEREVPKYQSIQPSSSEVMANLVSFIQEQQALITALTTRITALEAK
jgi:hypothetical protein